MYTPAGDKIRYKEQFIGQKAKIIVEGTNPVKGRCERYFMVKLPENTNPKPGQVVNYTIPH